MRTVINVIQVAVYSVSRHNPLGAAIDYEGSILFLGTSIVWDAAETISQVNQDYSTIQEGCH